MAGAQARRAAGRKAPGARRLSKRRILVFLPCFTHGGAERQGALLARYLRDEGNEVELWGFPSLGKEAPLKGLLDAWGLRHLELSAWPRFNWGVLGRMLWSYQLRSFARGMPRRDFDVVIPFTPWPCLVSALLRPHWNARTVIWNHRGGFDSGRIDFSPFLLAAILSRPPVFVANSNAGAGFLRQTFSLGAGQVHVIRNAFVPEAPEDRSPRAIDPTRPLQLLHLANLFAEKDPETLLRAVGRLKARGIECHLHVAGFFPNRGQEWRLKRLASALRIREQVTFHGALNRDEVHRLLKQADIGLLSSRSEGSPNSLMEYMYWRLPVVATDIPGIREIVGEDHAQWLFPVGDVDRLVERIAALGHDPQLRIALGMAHRKRIDDEFGPDKNLPKWKRLIEISSP